MPIRERSHNDPVRYVIVYASGSTSRQLYLDDVFTHVRLCRMAEHTPPVHVVDLARQRLRTRITETP